jgi:hypothetical protein
LGLSENRTQEEKKEEKQQSATLEHGLVSRTSLSG